MASENSAVQRFARWLKEPIDGHVIGLFRLVFGLFMVDFCFYYYRVDFIGRGLLAPQVLFKFDFFDWIPLFSAPVLNGILLLMGIAAALIAAGVAFRAACWTFALCLFYFLLQEKAYYNNHIYLFAILPIVLSATNADRYFSLRSKDRPFTFVPRWQQFILQSQIVIVYFFAGVVKVKGDWLVRGEPMTSLCRGFPDDHWMAPIINTDVAAAGFTYGGVVLDLLAPLLLWYRPVRNWAWIPFVLFHLTNSQIFDDIGTFPWVMLVAVLLFFDTNELPFLRRFTTPPGARSQAIAPTTALTRKLLIGYFAFQVLFPLRGFLLPNPMDYTNIGNRFAWRVKADIRKMESIAFELVRPSTQETHPVQIGRFINDRQESLLAADPRAVRDFARFLRSEAREKGLTGLEIRGSIRFGYNGRPPHDFVDPAADLASVEYSPFRRLEWVRLPPD